MSTATVSFLMLNFNTIKDYSITANYRSDYSRGNKSLHRVVHLSV